MSKFNLWSDDQLCQAIEKYIDQTKIGKHLGQFRETFVPERRESRRELLLCVEMIESELHLNLNVNSFAVSTISESSTDE